MNSPRRKTAGISLHSIVTSATCPRIHHIQKNEHTYAALQDNSGSTIEKQKNGMEHLIPFLLCNMLDGGRPLSTKPAMPFPLFSFRISC